MGSAEACRRGVMADGCAQVGEFIGHDRHPNARAADQNAAIHPTPANQLRDAEGEVGVVTALARHGPRIDDFVAELILNHALPGKLRRTYVLHRYGDEMREALERLAAFLDKIVSGEANVVRLRSAG